MTIKEPFFIAGDFESKLDPHSRFPSKDVALLANVKVDPLIQALNKAVEALDDINYNLEGYPDGRCDACSYNLSNMRPTAKETLAEIDKLLK